MKARSEGESFQLEAFVTGMLDGLSTGADVEFWHARGTEITQDATYLWLDGWCRQNPLKQIIAGVLALYKEQSGWQPTP